MESEDIQRLAYAMERAYNVTSSQDDATHRVADEFPYMDIPPVVLGAMWKAIDAYVDINTSVQQAAAKLGDEDND